ncbi:nuclear transport factor 2 [Exaiptasia diaphana]|uniref:Nuclear transport factor 2 n=1 Tax=Exaiptasia diaphana TaxID=2652724 RepID=A0A913X0W8_EXADI|nr:nuclear transport factor 2 [Exaiptasia diaphana]KXJ16357.1 Nuclear transport factor 2 [Exaiptasia diaphana]
MNPNFESIGKQFVNEYYSRFDTNRAYLKELYRPFSMLTFEGDQFQGVDAIITKLTSLPFQTVAHVITTTDVQPSPNNGVLVFTVGQLKTDNDPPHSFSQTFLLMPEDKELQSYYVLNDLFRLSLHHA